MSVLADKIEQFILHKLLEEDNSDIVLRRNELADELQCAPSQISYVLSTRFSNDRGYLVESRRGSGGFVRIIKLTPKRRTARRYCSTTPAGGQYFHGRPRCLAV